MCDIRLITVAEAWQHDNLESLFDEYAKESSIKGLGECNVNQAMYKALEDAGVIKTLGAFVDGELVGFLNIILSEPPHYSKRIATTESFFVTAKARRGGVGLKLLKAAEGLAKECGALGLFVSAPTGGRLEQIMPRVGYTTTNAVFFKGLTDVAD